MTKNADEMDLNDELEEDPKPADEQLNVFDEDEDEDEDEDNEDFDGTDKVDDDDYKDTDD